MSLFVTNIQRFCMHDGPGLRTTVFLKGCPLRCAWCHNPETQKKANEILYYPQKCIGCAACAVCPQEAHTFDDGIHIYSHERCTACGLCADACPTGALSLDTCEMTVDEVLSEVLKDRDFYGNNGGITLSGGEPTVQADELLTLLKKAKDAGITTALETCGYFDEALLDRLVPLVDTFLYDVKDTNAERHKRYTGVDNARILRNLVSLDRKGGVSVMRCILVKGVNADDEHYQALAELYTSLSHCRGIQFLTYHPYGSSKAQALGREDNGCTDWIPMSEDLAEAKEKTALYGGKIL